MLEKIIYLISHFFVKFRNRQLTIGAAAKIDPRAYIARGGKVNIGSNSIIRAGTTLLPSGGSIKIGKRTSINHYVVINGEGGVIIGDDVLIAAFVAIFAANHNYKAVNIPIKLQGMNTKGGIVIESDCWIGTHAVILDGVKIGKGSVIAAGSVVTKNVQENSIMAGVPARRIGWRGVDCK